MKIYLIQKWFILLYTTLKNNYFSMQVRDLISALHWCLINNYECISMKLLYKYYTLRKKGSRFDVSVLFSLPSHNLILKSNDHYITFSLNDFFSKHAHLISLTIQSREVKFFFPSDFNYVHLLYSLIIFFYIFIKMYFEFWQFAVLYLFAASVHT